MGKLKKAVSLVTLLLFSLTVFGCGSKTVAVVNGEKITQEQLDKEMANKKKALEQQGASFNNEQGKQMIKSLEQQTVQELIQQKILLQAVKKEGLMPTKSEIDKQIEALKKQFGGTESFNKLLKQYNYTMDDITEKVKMDLAYSKLFDKVTKDIKVSETDAENYYNQNKSVFLSPEKYKARMILIKYDPSNSSQTTKLSPVGRNEEAAAKISKEIISKLKNGTSFEELAKTKNDDETLKKSEGLLKGQQGETFFPKGSLSPAALDQALAKLKVGEYTDVIKTENAFYILKLEGKQAEKQLTFNEAKSEIMKQLPNQLKQQKFNEYFSKLLKDAKIENKLPAAQGSQGSPQGSADGGQQQSSGGQQQSSGGQQLPSGHPNI